MKIGLLIIGCLMGLASLAQQPYKGIPSATWPKLYNIEIKKSGDVFDRSERPIFSEAVKSLEGKTIVLPGYMVPFESGLKTSDFFMLSSLPLNACFFCGVGGPETAVEVYVTEKVSYREKPIEVKGTLRLNNSDPDHLFYILENARILGEIDP